MKKIVLLGALVAFGVTLLGQAKAGSSKTTKPRPAVVQIGDHRLGESFAEWLAVEKIDLDGACQDRKQTFTPEPPITDPKIPDDYPETLRDSYRKDVIEQDKRDKEAAARLKDDEEDLRHGRALALCNDLRPIRDTGSGYWHDRRGLPADSEIGTRWTFASSKPAGLRPSPTSMCSWLRLRA